MKPLYQARWKAEETGVLCEVVKLGVLWTPHWCGYVLVPKGHPWHGLGYDDIEATAHGGLTYADKDGDLWKVGFDCAHAGDGWQDEEWVRRECEDLARQAFRLEVKACESRVAHNERITAVGRCDLDHKGLPTAKWASAAEAGKVSDGSR